MRPRSAQPVWPVRIAEMLRDEGPRQAPRSGAHETTNRSRDLPPQLPYRILEKAVDDNQGVRPRLSISLDPASTATADGQPRIRRENDGVPSHFQCNAPDLDGLAGMPESQAAHDFILALGRWGACDARLKDLNGARCEGIREYDGFGLPGTRQRRPFPVREERKSPRPHEHRVTATVHQRQHDMIVAASPRV